MKKVFFGSASAILAVVGFSAFKSAKPTTTYYWFTYEKLNNLTTPAGTSLTTGLFVTGTFPAAFVTTEPTSPSCLGSTNDCKFAFTLNQIILTSGGTKISSVNGTEVPKISFAKD